MKADILREKFLNFFREKKHRVIESDSLVPKDDPTVLFTPAGMNQFKRQFMGETGGFRRAATCQRCLRTDDLEKVGMTPCHHTFFEMLGNFSFGDYFKKEAIAWAWEFLSETLKIDKERLWVSVYSGDKEAYEIWKKEIGFPQERIIKLGDKENFWPSEARVKGPNGPCGPCSEIFFDWGRDAGCGKADCSPACSCGRFSEVWNLVFTQFNRKEGGVLEPLPQKNIDTGMGLERLAAVMQGVKSNFETGLFQPIIKEIVSWLPHKPSTATHKEMVYAVADHMRAIIFSIYDGVLPSNEARGYVVRKLIRKSELYLRWFGLKNAHLFKLVPVVAAVMENPYPQLKENQENIAEIILSEEKNFISILNSSDKLFKEKFENYIKKPNPEAVGRITFQLYDTYGMPLEVIKNWLEERKIKISEEAFRDELEQQRIRSKARSAMKGDVFGAKLANLGVRQNKFLGYKEFEAKAKILKIFKDEQESKKAGAGENAVLILDKTVFYPESGGQVGDTGKIIKGKNIFEVTDTRKNGKVILHLGVVKSGSFSKGQAVAAAVDRQRRMAIARNHTATHLLQAALRKVLGPHVKQQGSLVAPQRLRFDFTHFKDISAEELQAVEDAVNDFIIKNYPLVARKTELSRAKKNGALAFFAEKYEEKVRVVNIGGVSSELCGGTHLDFTGQIGFFKITQESSVASGIRRIEAVTGKEARRIIREEEDLLADLCELLGAPRQRLLTEIEKKIARVKELEKKLSIHKAGRIETSIDSDINKKEKIAGIDFILHIDEDADSVRRAVDLIKEKVKGNAVIVSSTGENLGDKIFLAVGVSPDLCSRGIDAGKLIRAVSGEIGGSGGGRKDFAQAGGNSPRGFDKALEKLKEELRRQ